MIILFKFFPRRYIAMAIWPFIFVRDKTIHINPTLLNHEKIHFRQQIEMLWIFFFIWYTTEFIIHLIRFRNWDKAYRTISFEKEAYTHESNLNYMRNRKLWSFLKYL